MARIRMIKPEFFDDPDIGELSMAARLLFIGLWTQADKEGRLEADWRRLKARIFPYDDVDIEALAGELHGKNMICRFKTGQAVEKHGYVWIRNFTRHQRPHPKEPASLIPPCPSEAVEKHGEPEKNTADPPESGEGTRNLDSGEGVRAPSARPAPLVTRRRRDAAWEGPRVYVPQRLHADFLALRGAESEPVLLDWYQRVSEAWTDGPRAGDEPGPDMFRFWKDRYGEEWPVTRVDPRVPEWAR